MIIEVSARTGISVDNILGRTRTREVAIVRELYYKLILEKKCFSITLISKLCERSYATIQSGINHVNDLLSVGDGYTVRMWNQMKGIEP